MNGEIFDMLDKLNALEERFIFISKQISDPEVIADHDTWRDYCREHSELSPIIDEFHVYKKALDTVDEDRELLLSLIHISLVLSLFNSSLKRSYVPLVFPAAHAHLNIRVQIVQLTYHLNDLFGIVAVYAHKRTFTVICLNIEYIYT